MYRIHECLPGYAISGQNVDRADFITNNMIVKTISEFDKCTVSISLIIAQLRADQIQGA